ncbi:hypothetical protein [Rosistilla oblonga]|uniref:hypothetical protein n=1 Tax=Rosistilla oblonga TaxID=2527990 RepID=UPI003A96DB33
MNRMQLSFSNRIVVAVALFLVAPACGAAEPSIRELNRFAAAEAHQAVAVDATSYYAISSRAIGRYEKQTNQPIANWTAPADSTIQHLNSGLVYDGRLYCAHSNWPASPLKNTLEIFDAATLKPLESKAFPESEGAINWIDRQHDAWWIVFAFYGEEASRTQLVRYDDNWKPTGHWTFPASVVERFLPNSNSGGSFGPNGNLYVTGHDRGELYVLEVPEADGELIHVNTLAAPIAGQGIAWDRSDVGSLYGIVRRNKEVVAMQMSNTEEFTKLKRPVEWVRNKNNPVIPPRGEGFDATRCMNPWVVRSGDNYRVFYAGRDKAGTHTLGMATSAIGDLADWERTGPLFGSGAPGSFDAKWCVLPHAVKFGDAQWHLYYTGNAGRGVGLSSFPGLGVATSSDGINWTRSDRPPVLAPSGEYGTPDAIGIAGGSLIAVDQPDGSKQWWFYYTGCPTTGKAHALNQQKTICLAVSDDGIHWEKRGAVMVRNPERDYENIAVAGPVVLRDDDGMYRMWYSAIGTRWGFYSIAYAESDDGIHWRRGVESDDNLQLTPNGSGWEKQMVEYPTVIREGDHLRMFYCGNGYGTTGIGTAVSK